MRRLVSVALILTVALLASPGLRALALQNGTLAGKALDAAGNAVPPNSSVRILDAQGNVVRTVPVGADGSFSVTGLPAGSYSIELVNSSGVVFGTTSSVVVAAGATTTVAVTASVAAAAAAATAGTSAALIAALGAAGVAAIAATVVVLNGDDDSPSR